MTALKEANFCICREDQICGVEALLMVDVDGDDESSPKIGKRILKERKHNVARR